MRHQDIGLAKKVNALSPSAQEKTPIYNRHGADIIFGGHDHLYYVSKGVTFWENYDLNQEVLGGEQDHGDVLVIKSGTDFRDVSDLKLELADTPEGSIRRKVIKTIKGEVIVNMLSISRAQRHCKGNTSKRHRTTGRVNLWPGFLKTSYPPSPLR